MFKTRQNKLFIQQQDIIISPTFDYLKLQEFIEFFEECYPSIHNLYNRINSLNYFASNPIDIETDTTISLIQDDAVNPSFQVSGPIILIYSHLMRNTIPSLIKSVIGIHVDRHMIPETLFKDEFDTNVKKYICRKKHGTLFCPIESEEIKVGRTVCELQCGHKFTSRAIRKWLTQSKGHCPMCRFEVRTDKQKSDYIDTESDHIMFTHYFGISRLIPREDVALL